MKVRGIPLPLSKSCRDVNPQLEKKGVVIVPAQTVENVLTITVPHSRSRTRVGLRCGMNKTESEYWQILQEQKQRGEILRAEFEGITLRFANVRYTPDFTVFYVKQLQNVCWIATKFVETKGGYIKGNRERAVERFRHAKTYWPEFTFEMHQRTKDGWRQLI